MQTHDQTLFCDDFIAQRQSDEWDEPCLDLENDAKEGWKIAKQTRWLTATVFRIVIVMAFLLFHMVSTSVELIRWASTPQKKAKPKQVRPTQMLEFTFCGLLVVCGLASTLL